MLPAIQAASPIYLETAPLIYFIEQHPDFGGLVQPAIAAIDRGDKQGLTSYLTLLEVQVKPLDLNQEDLVDQYRQLLTASPNLRLMPVNQAVAEEAARIRAQYRFRTPDALHLASAVVGGADLFITNFSPCQS